MKGSKWFLFEHCVETDIIGTAFRVLHNDKWIRGWKSQTSYLMTCNHCGGGPPLYFICSVPIAYNACGPLFFPSYSPLIITPL